MPALLTSTSTAAESRTTPARRTPATPSRSAGRSPTTATPARAPGTVRARRSSRSVRRPQMPTVAPRAANPSASAAPIPADPPVTNTCLPFKSYVMRRTLASAPDADHARLRPAHRPARGRHRRRAGHRRGGRDHARPVRRRRRDLRPRRRRARAHRGEDRGRPAATRTSSCSTCATRDAVHERGSNRSTGSTCSSTTRAAGSTPRSSTSTTRVRTR